MIVVKVTCDSCGSDVTSAASGDGYRISVKSESLPFQSGIVYAVLRTQTPERHFCGFRCFSNYYRDKLTEPI